MEQINEEFNVPCYIFEEIIEYRHLFYQKNNVRLNTKSELTFTKQL